MKVIQQVSTNFHDLHLVVDKFKEKHVDKVKDVKGKLAAEQVKTKQYEEETHDLKAAVQQLSWRAGQCDDLLRQMQSKPTTTTTTQVASASKVVDWQHINKTETAEISDLQKQNAELKASVSELTQRVGEFTGKSVDEASRADMLENELGKMRKENAQLKTDKDAVVKTLQDLMSEENFKGLRHQAQEAQDLKVKLTKEFLAKEQKVKKEEERMKGQLKDRDEDEKLLQQKGQELEMEHDSLKATETRLQNERDVLATDKDHLLKTVQSLMRQNMVFKEELARCPNKQSQLAQKPVNVRPAAREDPTAVMGATSTIDAYLATQQRSQDLRQTSEAHINSDKLESHPSLLSSHSSSDSDGGWIGAAEFVASGSELLADAAPPHSRKHALANWLSGKHTGHKARGPRHRLSKRSVPNSFLSMNAQTVNAPWKASLLEDVERLSKYTAA